MAVSMMTCESNAHLPNVKTIHDYTGHRTGALRHPEQCPNAGKRRDLGHQGYCMENGVLMADGSIEAGFTLPAGCFHTAEEAGAAIPEDKKRSQGYYATPCSIGKPLYMMTTHVGMVVATREMNGYDDSDFYATVYNPDTDTFFEVCYASTRGWTYPNGASVDATPEVAARWKAHKDAIAESNRRAREVAAEAKRIQDMKDDAARVEKGKIVRVARGRKVPVGIVGEVFWLGESNFGLRAGIRDPFDLDRTGEVQWVAASNLDVVCQDADEYRTMAAYAELAPALADPFVEAASELAPVLGGR